MTPERTKGNKMGRSIMVTDGGTLLFRRSEFPDCQFLFGSDGDIPIRLHPDAGADNRDIVKIIDIVFGELETANAANAVIKQSWSYDQSRLETAAYHKRILLAALKSLLRSFHPVTSHDRDDYEIARAAVAVADST